MLCVHSFCILLHYQIYPAEVLQVTSPLCLAQVQLSKYSFWHRNSTLSNVLPTRAVSCTVGGFKQNTF